MAVVLAFRLAIAIAPHATRWAKAGQPPAGGAFLYISDKMMRRLSDPAESDEQLSADMSAESGNVVEVATYSDTFELRKLQVLFTRDSGDAAGEDSAVITYHFLKLVAGAPNATWIAGDFTTIENAWDVFWAAIRGNAPATTKVNELRWYRTGPQRDTELGGPGRTGPPVRVTDRDDPGTSVNGALPPQVALTITEQTSSRKTWGRTYLPLPNAGSYIVANKGRISTALQTSLADAADTFYEACRTANTPIVVYSTAKPERPTASGGTLPAIGARALTVDQIQVDDVTDVIRSRRWERPLLKVQRAIG